VTSQPHRGDNALIRACEPITPLLGARVHLTAADIARTHGDGTLRQALDTFGMLVFPRVGISDEALVALSDSLGEMEAAQVTADGSAASARGIYRIALDKSDKSQREYVLGNNYWHMDGLSYRVPGKATLLKCEAPPREGGDTEFANLAAAWDALAADEKATLAKLRVLHSLEPVGRRLVAEPTAEDLARWGAVFPPTEHPLVLTLDDGRHSLAIGSTAHSVPGMSPEEGGALLDRLLAWSTQERFTYRHHWQQGDLVIWHNPALLHRSHPYPEDAGRVMHRSTVKGRA
jgi:alpha-ketoglutarate-dependent taurine dioxygenase